MKPDPDAKMKGQWAVHGAGGVELSPVSPRSKRATLAQLVERLIRNQQVAGSTPAGGSIQRRGRPRRPGYGFDTALAVALGGRGWS